MKKTRIVASTLAAVLLVSGFSTGYAAKIKPMASKSKVSISFLNGKGEIAKQLEATAKLFNKTNKDGITLTIQSVSASSTVEETLMSKYAAGNPCTINAFGPDDYADYASKAIVAGAVKN